MPKFKTTIRIGYNAPTTGTIRFKHEGRDRTVKFAIDADGWNQWGACEEVLRITLPEVDRIKKLLEC